MKRKMGGYFRNTKSAPLSGAIFVFLATGSYLLSRAVPSQVPSALKGLTSVFGMRTGDPLRHYHR